MGSELVSVLTGHKEFELVGGADLRAEEIAAGVPVSADPAKVVSAADVVIDFSLPEGAMRVLQACVNARKPLVTGTTGPDPSQMKKFQTAAQQIPIVQSFNFSIGINLLLRLTGIAAEMLGGRADAEIVETHHRQKKDAPSGTALLLAEKIAKSSGRSLEDAAQFGRHGKNLQRENEIGIHSLRGGSVIGEHQVSFFGENENVILTHQALNRRIFVDGALLAARWITGKPAGLYGMDDVLTAAASS